MKRFFSLIVVALALHSFVFAQCPDTSLHGNGFHPPADQLTPIERNSFYDETVQVNIPPSFDTTVPLLGLITVTIDSVHINSVTGQPSGITHSCTPASCTFNGGSPGCMRFTGTTSDTAGQYPLTVNITAYVTVPVLGPQVQTLDMSALGFTYYLTVVEANALSVSVSADPSTICAGESSILTATVTNGSGAETFAWSNSSSTTDTAIVSPSATATYTVTVTDGSASVTGTATITVENLPVAGFTSSTAAMPTIAFTNTSQNATSYSWDFDDGGTSTDANPTHTYTAIGTYDVVLTAINDCGSTTALASVTITALAVTVSANPSTICAGESSILTATVTNGSGAETFAWSNSSSNSDTAHVSPSVTTTYTVTVTDGGTSVTGSATITVNNPVAGFTSSNANMPTIAFTNTSQNATSYSWDFDDGSTGTDTDPTHTYTANGTYDVVLTATNSCGNNTATASVTITGVYIKSIENNLKFSVAPNPNEGMFNIMLAGTDGKPATVRVYDMSGKNVFEETFSGSVERQMNLTSLPKGVYTLHLSSEKSSGVQRLVIR